MSKDLPFTAAVNNDPVTLYMAQAHDQLIAELQDQLAQTTFHFALRPLEIEPPSNSALQPVLLVMGTSVGHAMDLAEQHNLLNRQVYWLVEETDDLPTESTIPQHWFIDWRSSGALVAILSLLKQHNSALQTNQNAEHKLALLSDSLGELSLTLNAEGNILELNPKLLNLLGGAEQTVQGQNWLSCLHIPSGSAKTRMQHILAGLKRTHSMTRLPPFPIQLDNRVIMVDGFVGPLPNDKTLLILRQVASWRSQDWADQLNELGAPVTLLLVNPDGFAEFNCLYGRELGDQVLNQIMQDMSDMLRSDDFVSRYSGAVFAAHLPNTSEQQGQILAARMQQMLQKTQFSNKKIKLEFSLGLATLDAEAQIDEQSPLELFRRANTALQAARSIGGGKLVSWQPQFDASILANLDRMSGKFSKAPEEDFRLMTLQWDIIRLIGSTHSLETFSTQVCQLLNTGLQSAYFGLYVKQGDGLRRLSCSAADDQVEIQSIHQWVLKAVKIDNSSGQILTPVIPLKSFYHSVIPLITRGKCLGVLIACWQPREQRFARKCVAQVQQVTPNLAAAIDRIMLLDQTHNRRVMRQKEQSGEHELLFGSAAMSSLIQQVQMVAPTDASVLIIGETGTGKEVIAQRIHQYSLYPDKPFITVDCSTIVEHLIESELFGHRKGAFTGATSQQPGLIAQADGGTLFLDEVGELPLDIQSKLLRFVQEKTYVAVGDQRVRKVDVRLILATNRNLPAEVAAGRFRADLYYRINVITLNLPPLNQREDDSLLLARHYLKKFNGQYQKDIIDFSEAANSKLRTYSWPGNVRELRNCIMRAVILCSGHYVEPEQLILQHHSSITDATSLEPVSSPPSILPFGGVKTDNIAQISILLNKVVIVASQQPGMFPVSAWLEKQWLSLCVAKWGSLYQVAQQLSLSESTLRRRFAKLSDLAFDFPELAALAEQFNSLLESLLAAESVNTLWPTIEACLHTIVFQLDVTQLQKAKLLNVTQPTLRKIMHQTQALG